MRRAVIMPLATLLCAATGCQSLHMRDDEGTGTKILKGVARIPVAVVTVGTSEIWHARERTMESWLGHHTSELLLAWGPPADVTSDGLGNEVWTYAEQRSSYTPGTATTSTSGSASAYGFGNAAYVHGTATSRTSYSPAQVHQWSVFRRFMVNSGGVVTAYSWSGL